VISSISDIDNTVNAIYNAYNNACNAMMKQKSTAPGFNAHWWTDNCKAAAHALHTAGILQYNPIQLAILRNLIGQIFATELDYIGECPQ
jgi:hypothetical protein